MWRQWQSRLSGVSYFRCLNSSSFSLTDWLTLGEISFEQEKSTQDSPRVSPQLVPTQDWCYVSTGRPSISDQSPSNDSYKLWSVLQCSEDSVLSRGTEVLFEIGNRPRFLLHSFQPCIWDSKWFFIGVFRCKPRPHTFPLKFGSSRDVALSSDTTTAPCKNANLANLRNTNLDHRWIFSHHCNQCVIGVWLQPFFVKISFLRENVDSPAIFLNSFLSTLSDHPHHVTIHTTQFFSAELLKALVDRHRW